MNNDNYSTLMGISNIASVCKVTYGHFRNLLDFINNPIGLFREDQYPGYEAMDKENSNPEDWTDEELEQRTNACVWTKCFSMKNKEHVKQVIKELQQYIDAPNEDRDCLIYFKAKDD